MKWLALVLIGLALMLTCLHGVAAPRAQQQKPVGKITEIRGTAYWKAKGSDTPQKLDPKKDMNHPLYPEDGLRCEPGGQIKVIVYGVSQTIPPSEDWTLIPFAADSGDTPNLRGGAAPAALPPGGYPRHKSGETGLYDSLYGSGGISAVANALIDIMAKDERMRSPFRKITSDAQLRELKENLTYFICRVSEGRCSFREYTPKDVFRDLQITDKTFDFFIEDLQKVLNDLDVRVSAQEELIRRIWRMKDDLIVK